MIDDNADNNDIALWFNVVTYTQIYWTTSNDEVVVVGCLTS